jgi:modified peptide precursor CbpA
MWVFLCFKPAVIPPGDKVLAQQECGIPCSLARGFVPGCACAQLIQTSVRRRAGSLFVQGKEVIPVKTTNNSSKRTIIATRKGCDANGTGLSHYVMMDNKK